MERLLLHPRDYGFEGKDVPLESDEAYFDQLKSVLHGTPSELMKSAIWNSGFYLWRGGVCDSFEAGLAKAETMLTQGLVARHLDRVKTALNEVRSPIAAL